MKILETSRLRLRYMDPNRDLSFIIELLNSPGFLKNIGDRGVRDAPGARDYIAKSTASYEQHGYGLYTVELLDSGVAIGICGLVKRDHLPDADIGFAFLPQYWKQGYALEASKGTLRYSREILRMKKLLAVVNPENVDSIRLLEKLGFKYEGSVQMREGEPPIALYQVAY